MSEKENKLVLLPDEFYPETTSDLKVIAISEYKKSLDCRQFADYYFGDDKPKIKISVEEIQALFEKMEKENHHFENENGDVITFEKLLEIKKSNKKCVLFLVPNEPDVG